MEIDNHILSLSMEFEKQNIIINEYETTKAKEAHDRAWRKRKTSVANSKKSADQERTLERSKADAAADKETEEDAYEGDKEESGFEDNGSATNDDDEEPAENDDDDTDEDAAAKASIASNEEEEDHSDDDDDEGSIHHYSQTSGRVTLFPKYYYVDT